MLGPAAGRFVLDDCLRVDSASFFFAGTFSFTLSFLPPSSGQGFVDVDGSAAPAGSTKGRMVALVRDVDGAFAGELARGAVDLLEEDVARAVRREELAAGTGASGGGAMAAHIMRFWNSWCRLFR